MTQTVTTPALQLRPVQDSDLQLLLAWRNDLETLPFWYPRRYPVSREQFEREFRDIEASSTHVRFIVELGEKAIGTVYTYNYSALHGWVYLATYLEPASRRQGLGTRAMQQFAAWLFANYPLRKLYSEVYSFNIDSNSALQAAGLQPEAVFHQHIYWRGGYHDLLLYSLIREQFNTMPITRLAAVCSVGTGETDAGTRVTAAVCTGKDSNLDNNLRERR